MEFLMLPDDVLLMVLGELNEKDTFTCRLVCKRLAALALHPDLWRHYYADSSDPCACPVLRLAPCLDMMYINLPPKGCHQWTFASTRCASKKLWIYVDGSSNAAHAAAIICKQEVLGRLTDVYITIESEAAAEVTMLLGMLAVTSRLEKLRVDASLPSLLLSTATAPILGSAVVTSSLTVFDCRLSVFSEPFVNFILSEHAATLERVRLAPSPYSWKFTSTAPLLGSVTNLSQLTCCCLPGMEVLTACKSLRVLELTVDTESKNRPAIAGVAKLLRLAEHLREVSLQYAPAVRSDTDVGVELVLALASGRSRVETLIIHNWLSHCGENSPLHRPVVSALPSLPALRRLNLNEYLDNPDKILLAISPDVAPALQKVEVYLREGCAHSWIHGETVKSVFTLNPTLHVRLWASKSGFCDTAYCQACQLDCHAELKALGWFHHWFFSHDPTIKCSVEHPVRVSFQHWVHLPL